MRTQHAIHAAIRSLAAARLVNSTLGGDRHSAAFRTNGISVMNAAYQHGVSERSVHTARKIIRHADADIIGQIERGELALHVAEKMIAASEAKAAALPGHADGAT